MNIRVCRRAPKSAVAMAGLITAAIALSGCSSLGSRAFSDNTTTGSVQQSAPTSTNQRMPSSLGAPQAMVAETQFLPPAPLGNGGTWNSQPAQPAWNSQPAAQPAWNQPAQTASSQPLAPLPTGGSSPSVQSQDLPVLSSSSQGSLPAMQAQPAFASAAPMPSPAALGSLPTNSSVPSLASVSTPAASAAGGSAGPRRHPAPVARLDRRGQPRLRVDASPRARCQGASSGRIGAGRSRPASP